jgi:hypothetical protein
MKNLTLTLLSIAMGLFLGSYYSLVMRKLLLEYVVSAYLSVRFMTNDESNLITAENSFNKR